MLTPTADAKIIRIGFKCFHIENFKVKLRLIKDFAWKKFKILDPTLAKTVIPAYLDFDVDHKH